MILIPLTSHHWVPVPTSLVLTTWIIIFGDVTWASVFFKLGLRLTKANYDHDHMIFLHTSCHSLLQYYSSSLLPPKLNPCALIQLLALLPSPPHLGVLRHFLKPFNPNTPPIIIIQCDVPLPWWFIHHHSLQDQAQKMLPTGGIPHILLTHPAYFIVSHHL